jgi:hypothetical protein
MTSMQQFIEKAILGGWQPDPRRFSIRGFYERHFEYELRGSSPGRAPTIRYMVYEMILLDPKAWQAVGKVEKGYEGYYGPEWRHHMHKMIDALAEGCPLEAYVQSVLNKAQNVRQDNR